MKTYAIILLLCGATFAAGYTVGAKRNARPGAQAPAVEDTPAARAGKPASQPSEPVVYNSQPSNPTPEPAPAPAVETPPPAAPRETSALPAVVSKAIDTLISPQATLKEKRSALQAVREAGQLDQTIEALRQGAAQNTNAASWQSALGQALLQKAGVVSRTGGNVNEMGILGMQADQSFDAALKIDPSNWDAQFLKAIALSHWPAELNKSDEVVQRLSHLIDQQESLPLQPQFAQTYVILGEQYLKMGQADYAAQTWKLGLQKFPGDPTLQQKVAGH